jgi:hypothetical protein
MALGKDADMTDKQAAARAKRIDKARSLIRALAALEPGQSYTLPGGKSYVARSHSEGFVDGSGWVQGYFLACRIYRLEPGSFTYTLADGWSPSAG